MAKLVGQILLIAGSAVGAGLLALPAVTYSAGFVPSCAALSFIWLYMGATALLMIEAAAVDPPRPNLLGMAQKTLGSTGRAVCLVLYTAIYAATLTAYISEGGRQAATIIILLMECLGTDFVMHCSTYPVPHGWVSVAQTFFAMFFGCVVGCGPNVVERLNSICMCGAVVAFILLVRAATSDEYGSSGDLQRGGESPREPPSATPSDTIFCSFLWRF